jgi:hypothetical protein
MNLVGIIIPGERPASIAGNTVTLPLAEGAPQASVVEMPVAGAFAFEPELAEGGALA